GQGAAAVAGDAHLRAEQGLCGGGAEADEHRGLDEGELGEQPRPAGADLVRLGFHVDAPLAAGLPAEVLDRIADVYIVARDAGGRERAVEHAAGGTDERRALTVFLIAG